MGRFLGGFLLPLLLLTAALLNWSLISLGNLIASLIILFTPPKRGFHLRGRTLLWSIVLFSFLVIISQVAFLITWAIECGSCDAEVPWWAKLLGFMIVETWRSPIVIYLLIVQLLVAVIASVELHESRLGLFRHASTFLGSLSSAFDGIGSHVKVGFCLLLPAVQLVVGISNSSWVSLPFFVCSCVGLVDWSLTSNFHGLFRWWKPLWFYAGFNIFLLYIYQLPLGFPTFFTTICDFIGLYQVSTTFEWPQICSSLSLIIFCFMLSFVKFDLEEMDSIMSMSESNLTEYLLPIKNSFFVRESRSGVRHTNVLLRGAVFRIFSINFFTYGVPVSLCALSLWSFYFASVCAFGLLAYVGYVIFAYPSLFRLHRLNGLLLVFILLWAVSTYIFNVAFSYLHWDLEKDMEIWEMVGLWHYPIPGFFILAQFCLGVLVALGNLVNNSVFLYISDEEDQPTSNGDATQEVTEDTKVLIVATIAWVLRKCSRAIMLVLIFLIAMKPGFIHALYMIFFFLYLLSHDIGDKVRHTLLLLCELHFALLYSLQITLVSQALEKSGSLSLEILSQLGFCGQNSPWDFVEIALLACFCAIHKHGYDLLFSFSAIVQHTPYPPVGFSILKAGLNKSVLLSVYASGTATNSDDNLSQERKVASYLGAIGQKFLSIYRSFGTYIAFLTILITVYMARPNFVSFGFIFLLLFWITGRQLVQKTKRRLWYPLKLYSIVMFIITYILSIFPAFKSWVSTKVDLYAYLGYNPDASLLTNVYESLAIMIVMQLYSYERRQSRYRTLEDPNRMQFGFVGFIQRLLIWHSQKILFGAMFYAAISPISAFGFLHLLGIVLCSILPKASRIPSNSFLVYTGVLVTVEYLFQMLGGLVGMFPGQQYYSLSVFLGLKVYDRGFWGVEAGLRAKVLVVAACTLQYNVFYWLKMMPSWFSGVGQWEEPCPLFFSEEDVLRNVDNDATASSSGRKTGIRTSSSWPSARDSGTKTGVTESNSRRYLLGYFLGSVNESHKWNKKRVLELRKERFIMQKTSLKVYLKFWMENMFILFGLEITMIALLLASFALLNAVSILYIASLAACVLLGRQFIRKVWPFFVFLFATILVLEYFAIWRNPVPSIEPEPEDIIRCHECWRYSVQYFGYCCDCWLGLTVDDPRVLSSYFLVFMFACFKLRADRFGSFSGSFTYRQMIAQRKNSFVWRDLSFETKSMWTILDYLRLYCYCHLLDLVLALILITGTLEYDILHLGYLAFALIFFRMRLTILKKKNKIFKWLRMYNFAVIVLSLAYQSPFIGAFNDGKCETVDYIYEVIGFYKYDYGFRITSRSALVEIVIFILVSLQSYMFASEEFDYVFRYLEAEQIGAIVREQEKKAAWKTAQLQYIREAEEMKRQRNLQVEKMKSEMLNLQIQPERIESGVNQVLRLVHDARCKEPNPTTCPCPSIVQVQSIEKSEEDSKVALVVFEVVYASPPEECTLTERYKSLTPAADVAKEITEAQSANLFEKVGFPYRIISVIGGGKREIDLYAYTFGADLAVFFLVAIFYQSVIKNKSELLDVYQLEDQFPKEFVFFLMAIFFLIVLDRIIYLCSFATGKVIFYIFNLVLFTYCVTLYAWNTKPSQQSAVGFALRAIYLTKAISLAFQATQIRSGIPHKSTLYRQFLTSSVSRVNYLGYRLYRALPFLYELRCVLDWSCTTTSLTMYDWLKLEDINASLYLVKCDSVLNRANHKQGERQTRMTKFCNGICLFFILIIVIWAPMLMYSSGNPTNIANPINDASIQFDIKTDGGRLMLYQTTLCSITPWTDFDSSVDLDPYGYLESYNVNDIQLICCQADATDLWLVPNVIQTRFSQSIDKNMDMKFSWILTRDRPKDKEVVKFGQNLAHSDLPDPSAVKQVLEGSSDTFRVNNTYPRYFRVTGSGEVRVFDQEATGVDGALFLNRGESQWWSFYDISLLNSSVCGDLMGPMAIVVSEETPQGFLGETLSKFSIWGLYITFVLAVGRFIRLQCSDLRMRIPFENLPSCDRLIAICEDIYAARSEGELGVEEVLYWTLVKIYRSPHMLLEYTNPE
ncbi:putative Piezo family protein [Helianthus annuus]|nr:putative Piezo family protein [Helianthus annuus]